MQCVVLAAGEGKRMRPLTASQPKAMLPVGNKPMMEYLVDAAKDAGIEEFIFVVGYGEREVRRHFSDGSDLGIAIQYATQRNQRGTADALNAARELVHGNFLLLNGDMIIRSRDIRNMMNLASPCMGIYPSDHPWDYGVVTEHDGLVTALDEKSTNPDSNLVNAGIYVFDPSIFGLLDAIPLSPRGELELTDALGVFVRQKNLRATSLEYWMDIGYPWDLLDANASMLSNLDTVSEGTSEENVVLKGSVSVGEGTTIKSGTYIEGPCIIGRNCSVGPHAYIRGATSIGNDCHIGHAAEIKNSIIMDGTKIPHFNYIGDSVVGSGCNIGAGTKVANLRHDKKTIRAGGRDTRREKFGAIIGDDVRIGINCSLNTGTIIGAGTRIAPHSYIEGSIGEHTRVN